MVRDASDVLAKLLYGNPRSRKRKWQYRAVYQVSGWMSKMGATMTVGLMQTPRPMSRIKGIIGSYFDPNARIIRLMFVCRGAQAKTRFWQKQAMTVLNARQINVLSRLVVRKPPVNTKAIVNMARASSFQSVSAVWVVLAGWLPDKNSGHRQMHHGDSPLADNFSVTYHAIKPSTIIASAMPAS